MVPAAAQADYGRKDKAGQSQVDVGGGSKLHNKGQGQEKQDGAKGDGGVPQPPGQGVKVQRRQQTQHEMHVVGGDLVADHQGERIKQIDIERKEGIP